MPRLQWSRLQKSVSKGPSPKGEGGRSTSPVERSKKTLTEEKEKMEGRFSWKHRGRESPTQQTGSIRSKRSIRPSFQSRVWYNGDEGERNGQTDSEFAKIKLSQSLWYQCLSFVEIFFVRFSVPFGCCIRNKTNSGYIQKWKLDYWLLIFAIRPLKHIRGEETAS